MKAYVFISAWVLGGGDDTGDIIELYATKEDAQARLKEDFESAKDYFEMYDEDNLDITQSEGEYVVCIKGEYTENHIAGHVLEREIK